MEEKFLWLLRAYGINYDDDVMVIASTQKEAEQKWDEIFGDDYYIEKSIKPIKFVDGYRIKVEKVYE